VAVRPSAAAAQSCAHVGVRASESVRLIDTQLKQLTRSVHHGVQSRATLLALACANVPGVSSGSVTGKQYQ
jgi:hypothetical protein